MKRPSNEMLNYLCTEAERSTPGWEPFTLEEVQSLVAEVRALQQDFTVISTKCGELMADLAVAKEAIDILIEERDLAQANSIDRERWFERFWILSHRMEALCDDERFSDESDAELVRVTLKEVHDGTGTR